MLPIWTGNNVEEVNRAALALALAGPQGVVAHNIQYDSEGMGALSGKTGELVTIRVGDSVFVTNKPICASLITHGSLWRTGPYAGCHVRRYNGEERHHFFLTVYQNCDRPFHRGVKQTFHAETHAAGSLLRGHARAHWFR